MEKKARVLIVEDEQIVGIDLKKTLLKLNYEVMDVISRGEEAISYATEQKPDIILMDIMLAGKINGIEAVRKIKDVMDVPVIYLTAYTDEKTIESAKPTDPYGYIPKPFEERNLHTSIEMALCKHQVNNKLKESEKKYRELVEFSPFAIGIYSENKVVFANDAGVRLFGAQSKEELLGKPIMELVYPSYRDLVQERVKKASVFREKLETIEEKLLRLDGKELDVEVSAIPIEFNGKNAVQVIIRDISDVKKKERIHQTTIKILQAVTFARTFEQLYSYLYKCLMDFLEIKNICFAVNDRLLNNISFPFFCDEFDEKPTSRNYGNGLIEYTIDSARAQLLKENEIMKLSNQKIVLVNEKIPKVWLGIPLILSENLILVISFKEYLNENYLTEGELELLNSICLPIKRVIEQKLIEEEKLSTMHKLEEMNRTKDNFFSIISHDLRSPFNSILGFTEVLKNEINQLSKENIKPYIDSLHQSSRQIYSLINNLLQYSKFQLGKIEFQRVKLNLSEIIKSNIEILGGSALKKEISIISEIEEGLSISGDNDMLNSIIINLLTNAIKFTKRNGQIKIRAKQKDASIVLEIEDNGIGMDENTIHNLFRFDSQKSIAGTENESGTGLGLLLVKEFIEKLNGSIFVKSELNKGSVFSVTLPLFDENSK